MLDHVSEQVFENVFEHVSLYSRAAACSFHISLQVLGGVLEVLGSVSIQQRHNFFLEKQMFIGTWLRQFFNMLGMWQGLSQSSRTTMGPNE